MNQIEPRSLDPGTIVRGLSCHPVLDPVSKFLFAIVFNL